MDLRFAAIALIAIGLTGCGIGRTNASRTTTSVAAGPFPVAKRVPGRPGMVFNPFKANGKYINVSGYAPGSKVKDPESQRIFIVP